MGGFLSQDDIDSLLGAAAGGSLSSSSAAVDKKGDLSNVAKNIVAKYNEHIKAVGNLNFSRSVSININSVELANASEVAEKIDGAYLIAEIPFTGGCEGSIRVMASKRDFAVIADLMVMGDGTAPYSEGHKDAITELFNQISGAFSTEIGGKIGKSVSASATSILDNVGVDILENDYAAFCTVSIDDVDPITLIISPDETLVEKLEPFMDESKKEESAASFTSAPSASVSTSSSASFSTQSGASVANSYSSKAPKVNVDMLLDIELEVSIELGKTNISIKKVLDLAPGSLVELDRLAGEPVDLLVNNKVVAKGEVIVIDENFGVRIISLVSPEERIKSLR
jgi:flagellar motor switch protein FliN/FliY